MKVLFATCATDCYVASCLWDGLQELLGEANVSDAGYTPSLHKTSGGYNHRISGSRTGRCLSHTDGRVYDLLVIMGSILRDHGDWHWGLELRDAYLKPGGKVVMVDGMDSPHEIPDPPFPVDAVFRREMLPHQRYGPPTHCLMMAAPSRWFKDGLALDAHRHIDVIAVMNEFSSPVRWECLQQIFQTKGKHRIVASSTGIAGEGWFDNLKLSRLCVCPPGGGSDCMRQWEAVAMGAIPIFVGHPPRVREPWFAADEIFWIDFPDRLPLMIDLALTCDLSAMRDRLLKNAIVNHTTLARARRLLQLTGL